MFLAFGVIRQNLTDNLSMFSKLRSASPGFTVNFDSKLAVLEHHILKMTKKMVESWMSSSP
jgi:hypothetical protein